MKFKAAIASSDLENVDTHFGRCGAFIIAEIDDENGEYSLVERREVKSPCPSCGRLGEPDDAIEGVAEALSDCGYVIASRIGRWPDSLLYEHGIQSVTYSGSISGMMASLFPGRLSGPAGKTI